MSMTKEERKEYMKAYYQAHKEHYKAYIQAHKEQSKAKKKAWYEAHKESENAKMKAWYEDNKEQRKANMKAYYKSHREERKAQMKTYRQAHKEECKAYNRSDVNSLGQTKDSIRCKSRSILKKSGIKIPGYEIHHCFGYEDASKFIYCSKELHLKIHQFLRDNNIDADSDHYEQIKHLLNEKVITFGL